jgi:type III secretion protein C
VKAVSGKVWSYLLFASVLALAPSGLVSKTEEKPSSKVTSNSPLIGGSYNSYEINFEDVSITEYLRFISKIGKLNFIYDESDLNFNTTIVSDEPASMPSILAALVHTLRMHDLDLIENGNTLTIVQKKGEPQMGTVVTETSPLKKGQFPPIITWVYKIKNANPQNVSQLIKPLLSSDSILEVSEDTRYMIVTDTLLHVEEVKKLLHTLDSVSSPLDMFAYTSNYAEPSKLIPILNEIMTPISKGNPLIFVPQNGRSKLFIISTPELVQQTLAVLKTIDGTPAAQQDFGPVTSKNILIYQVRNRPIPVITAALDAITEDILQFEKKPLGVIKALKTMRFIPESHSLIFMGLPEHLKEIDTILKQIDTPLTKEEASLMHSSIFVYKIQHMKPQTLMNSIIKLTKKIEHSPVPNVALIQALKSAKLVQDNRAIMFDGTADAIERIKQLLPVFDGGDLIQESATESYIYRPTFQTGNSILEELKMIGKSLEASGLNDEGFINTLLSGKWIPSACVLVFSGSPEGIEKLHSLVQSLDTDQLKACGGAAGEHFMIYTLKYANGKMILDQLKEVQQDLDKAHEGKRESAESKAISEALRSAKWLSSTNSLLVIAPPKVLDKIKGLLEKFDAKRNNSAKSFLYLYEPKHVTPKALKQDVINASEKMRKSGLDDYDLIDTLKAVALVSDGNSLLFTGSEDAVAKVKEIMPTMDVINPSKSTDFFIYSPLFVTADFLHKEIRKLAMDMERSDFSDPTFIRTLVTAKVIQEGNSLFFTTNATSLPKVKDLLKSIDNKNFASNDALRNQSIFFLYNTKHVSGSDLIAYLKDVSEDLNEVGSKDKLLIRSINRLKLVGNTNTIMITGSRATVDEVRKLAEKFDTTAFVKREVSRITSGYLLYTPRYQKGRALINLMINFESNLRNSGFTQNELFDVIDHLKWMPDGNTIIISGEENASKQVMSLLERFDVPTSDESEIEFMAYKVQFHSGEELLIALKQIGLDFASTPVKGITGNDRAFLNAVNRLQYISVTNSLITTGTEDAIKRVKKLIEEIDIPLRQVFVEVLIIETEMSNQLDFGLRWGSQGKYRDRFSYSTGTSPYSTDGSTDELASFQQNLQKLSATTTPTGQFFPLASGYDLGVMGDIIMHKGESYFAMGSLFNSLQATDDTTIIMNQKIIAQDNKNSTLFVGQNIPYTGSYVNNTGQNTVVQTSNLEYRDVGINLSITPTLTNGDIVTLSIDQEISEVVEQAGNNDDDDTTTGVQGIQTSKNTTKTVVSVPNKSFLVLSGQINNSVDENTASVPCLGALPFVGALFTDITKTRTNDNMIIFLRPQIIETFNDYKEITERQEEIHRTESGSVEEFDAGIELLKTPDDY